MTSKDAASIFGRIGFFPLLFLTFLIAADPVSACPQHRSTAAYRTRAVASRTVSTMAPVVISYRAPATYRRCGSNLYDTRGARYVAARGDRYQRDARYVAVRNGDGYYRASQKRYIAVRDADRYEAPRYVAVRRSPVYADSGVRYVAVRRAEPRVRYVDIREFEDDGYNDEIRYVKLRRHQNYDSGTRYVAVSDGNAYYAAPRTRYVAVRNRIDSGCARAAALRSCLDDVETRSVGRVVVRNDDYANRTKYVAVRDEMEDDDFDYSDGDRDVTVSGEIDDDAEYFVRPTARADRVKYIDQSDAHHYDNDGVAYMTPTEIGDPYGHHAAAINYPDTYDTSTVSYVPATYDDDIDDQAFLDGGGAAYVAADDIEDACLSTVGVREVPDVVSVRTVSYVPENFIDDHAFQGGSDVAYVETDRSAHAMRYVPVDDDEEYVVEADNVAYLEPEAVSYIPVENVEYVDAELIRYVPAQSSYESDVTYVAADDCPELPGGVEMEPVRFADASTVLVEEVEPEMVAGLQGTQRIAGNYGFRDGFEDGRDAALERDEYHPENSGDYQKATEGYEDDYGDKGVYKDAYRGSYLEGYQAGFDSGGALA